MSARQANEDRAKRIEQYYIRHNKDRKKTYKHFADEGLNKKTIYLTIRRHEQRGDVSFKKPTGRKASVCTPEMFDKLANLFKENPDLSCREAARKLGIARTTIFRIMAKMREKNLETYKVVESEPRCPTCHQKIDPKNTVIKQKQKKKVENKDKRDNETVEAEDDEEEDEGDDNEDEDGSEDGGNIDNSNNNLENLETEPVVESTGFIS